MVLHRPDPGAAASRRAGQLGARSTAGGDHGQTGAVVVYEDREVLAALDQALQSRFGADYQVLAATTPVAALDTLGRLREAGEQVALVTCPG